MTEILKSQTSDRRHFYLEERTFKFAKEVSRLSHGITRTIENNEYLKQLIRSSGSVAANYIEANESFGKKELRESLELIKIFTAILGKMKSIWI